MASDKSVDKQTQQDIQLSAGDLASLLERAIAKAVSEAGQVLRQPIADPKKEAMEAALAKSREESAKAAIERKKSGERKCRHWRRYGHQEFPRIAWMRNSDGVWRGVCQICSKVISPETCATPEYQNFINTTLDVRVSGSAAINQEAVAARKARVAGAFEV